MLVEPQMGAVVLQTKQEEQQNKQVAQLMEEPLIQGLLIQVPLIVEQLMQGLLMVEQLIQDLPMVEILMTQQLIQDLLIVEILVMIMKVLKILQLMIQEILKDSHGGDG